MRTLKGYGKMLKKSKKKKLIKPDMNETEKLQGSIDKGMDRALKNFRR